MRYSKIVDIRGEDAEQYLLSITDEDVNIESVIDQIISSETDGDLWDDQNVYDEIPSDDDDEVSVFDKYILVWNEDEMKVCLYVDTEYDEDDESPSDMFESHDFDGLKQFISKRVQHYSEEFMKE